MLFDGVLRWRRQGERRTGRWRWWWRIPARPLRSVEMLLPLPLSNLVFPPINGLEEMPTWKYLYPCPGLILIPHSAICLGVIANCFEGGVQLGSCEIPSGCVMKCPHPLNLFQLQDAAAAVSTKPAKRYPLALWIAILGLIMLVGVYIFSLSLKQNGMLFGLMQANMIEKEREKPCHDPRIPDAEIPYVHYPTPNTYDR